MTFFFRSCSSTDKSSSKSFSSRRGTVKEPTNRRASTPSKTPASGGNALWTAMLRPVSSWMNPQLGGRKDAIPTSGVSTPRSVTPDFTVGQDGLAPLPPPPPPSSSPAALSSQHHGFVHHPQHSSIARLCSVESCTDVDSDRLCYKQNDSTASSCTSASPMLQANKDDIATPPILPRPAMVDRNISTASLHRRSSAAAFSMSARNLKEILQTDPAEPAQTSKATNKTTAPVKPPMGATSTSWLYTQYQERPPVAWVQFQTKQGGIEDRGNLRTYNINHGPEDDEVSLLSFTDDTNEAYPMVDITNSRLAATASLPPPPPPLATSFSVVTPPQSAAAKSALAKSTTAPTTNVTGMDWMMQWANGVQSPTSVTSIFPSSVDPKMIHVDDTSTPLPDTTSASCYLPQQPLPYTAAAAASSVLLQGWAMVKQCSTESWQAQQLMTAVDDDYPVSTERSLVSYFGESGQFEIRYVQILKPESSPQKQMTIRLSDDSKGQSHEVILAMPQMHVEPISACIGQAIILSEGSPPDAEHRDQASLTSIVIVPVPLTKRILPPHSTEMKATPWILSTQRNDDVYAPPEQYEAVLHWRFSLDLFVGRA